MDPVTVVTTALASVNHVANLGKALAASLRESGKSEALGTVIDLQSAIIDLQQKHADLAASYQELKAENQKLKQGQDIRATLKFSSGVYHRTNGAIEEYYCGGCLDSLGKYIRVPRFDNERGSFWLCPVCKVEHIKLH